MAGLSVLALMAMSTASTIGGALDQRRAGAAAERQGEYEGGLLDANAGLADAGAADAIARGREAEGRQRGQIRRLAGGQRAALGGSGIDIDSGSALDVVRNDATMGELDALTIRNNARREAWGYQVQASDYRRQAELARHAGREEGKARRRQSFSTLLTGAGDLASIYASAPKRISRGGSIPSATESYRRVAKGRSGSGSF